MGAVAAVGGRPGEGRFDLTTCPTTIDRLATLEVEAGRITAGTIAGRVAEMVLGARIDAAERVG